MRQTILPTWDIPRAIRTTDIWAKFLTLDMHLSNLYTTSGS